MVKYSLANAATLLLKNQPTRNWLYKTSSKQLKLMPKLHWPIQSNVPFTKLRSKSKRNTILSMDMSLLKSIINSPNPTSNL